MYQLYLYIGDVTELYEFTDKETCELYRNRFSLKYPGASTFIILTTIRKIWKR